MRFCDAAKMWASFIDRERGRFDIEANNRFGSAFGQVSRYLTFMTLVIGRHHSTVAAFQEAVRAEDDGWGRRTKGEPINITPLNDRVRELVWQVQLDVESFYLFAKILLGKVANAVEFYFGPGRRTCLESHDKLRRHLRAFAEQKGLTLNPGFVSQAENLQQTVVEYRDKQVEHQKNPRTTHVLGYETGGPIQMFSTKLYPTERDGQVASTDVSVLEEQLCAYLEKVIEFIEANRGCTVLKVNDSNLAQIGMSCDVPS